MQSTAEKQTENVSKDQRNRRNVDGESRPQRPKTGEEGGRPTRGGRGARPNTRGYRGRGRGGADGGPSYFMVDQENSGNAGTEELYSMKP